MYGCRILILFRAKIEILRIVSGQVLKASDRQHASCNRLFTRQPALCTRSTSDLRDRVVSKRVEECEAYALVGYHLHT